MVPLIGVKDNFLIEKKYHGFAFKAFLRSKAALKIPVRKNLKIFEKKWIIGFLPNFEMSTAYSITARAKTVW